MFIYSVNIFLRAFQVSGIVLSSRTMVLDSEVKVAQSCPALYDSMNYTVHGILQARIMEWIDFLFSRGSSQPRDWTHISHTAGGFFTSWATAEADIQFLIDLCSKYADDKWKTIGEILLPAASNDLSRLGATLQLRVHFACICRARIVRTFSPLGIPSPVSGRCDCVITPTAWPLSWM